MKKSPSVTQNSHLQMHSLNKDVLEQLPKASFLLSARFSFKAAFSSAVLKQL